MEYFKRQKHYDGGISDEVLCSPAYQFELKKLQKHYGIRTTLNSYFQAAWDKEGAIARLDLCNELWLRVEAAMDIIGADFAIKIHPLLAEGLTAEDIICRLGSFRTYLKEELAEDAGAFIFGADICRELCRIKKHWWKVYHGGAEDVE